VSFRGSEIAVIGMAARVPGARNIGEYWRNLRDGVECITVFDDSQLLAAGESRDNLRNPGYVRANGMLADIDQFDAEFFGFSPQDAAIMDPQHRILLEVAWEALENAACDPGRFRGNVGVFATCGMNAYMMHHLVRNRRIMENVGEWLVRHTGNDMNFLATRLSYEMNLKGPSLNVQTACSSALVAIHLASQSLLLGECDMALAGGCAINWPNGRGYLYKPGEILSPDGHCRPFDSRAAGTVFGSGAGMVVLRRLSDAIEDRDPIAAIVLGSAVNNDGSGKVGYLAPSVDGQSKAISEALAAAGVHPESIAMIEAHGTGTAMGDPIEVAALTEAFRRKARKKSYCAIGSVKSNIGHLGEAAGAAGFIKAVLALQNQQIPPSLNFEAPNSQLDLPATPFYVNTRLREWASNGAPRRAGITALGAGGTNCHVIVQEAPARAASGASRPAQLLLLSGKNEAALAANSGNMAAFLKNLPEVALADVAYTLALGRKAFPYRRSVVAESREQAIAALQSETSGPQTVSRVTEPGAVFLFPGQGSQHPGMGRDLYEHNAVFRVTLDRCAEILLPHLGLDLRRELYEWTSADSARLRLQQTALAQPALFAVEYAIAQMWMHLGLRPAAMIGHSLGEYVAACVAGVFCLEDALAVVAVRGRLMQQMAPGAMTAVPLAAEETERLMNGAGAAQRLSLAAINAPEISIVAGSSDTIAEFEAVLRGRGIEPQRLHTSHAFHSAMMDPMLDGFRQRLRAITLRAPELPFVSNLSGAWIRPEEATDPEYWVRHLRNPVRFSDGVAMLLTADHIALECGPGNALTSLVRQQRSKPLDAFPSMPRATEQRSSLLTMLEAGGRLWSHGVALDLEKLWADESRQRVALPAYAFQHKSYWIEPDSTPQGEAPEAAASSAMADQPAALRKKPDIADWFYQPVWKPSRLAGAGASKKTWLVFEDESGIAEAALEALAQQPVRREETRLTLLEPGEVESLEWVAEPVKQPGPGEVAISVRATALNFADVLKASGAFAEAPFGMECAGVITALGEGVEQFSIGDEVVAIGPESHATRVIRDVRFVALKPEMLSFEEASTIPAAYMTACYALHDCARLRPGERVLIHAASGGVGLAAVEIARSLGLEIFATAGSPEKREFLRSLGIQHVFDSRQLDFAEGVLEATGGQGVDAVLNSLTGEFIPKSLSVLREGGRFLEIGKRELLAPGQLSAMPVKPQIQYTPIDLTKMLRDDPDSYGRLLHRVVEQVRNGKWRALPRRTFAMGDAVAAFQYMLQTRHTGKVVLSLEETPRRYYRVRAGKKFEQEKEHEFVVNPSREEDYAALLNALGEAAQKMDGIAHFWNVSYSPQACEKQLERSFFSLAGLGKAISKMQLEQPIDCLVFSNRLHGVAGETDTDAVKATLLGPVRVIPRELENVRCRSVDLPEAKPDSWKLAQLARQIASEMDSESTSNTIAYRGADRWSQMWEPAPLPAVPAGTTLRERGVYFITGAFGGIGTALSEHLAKSARARLVMVTRSALPPRGQWSEWLQSHSHEDETSGRIRHIQQCEAAGAEVLAIQADVTSRKQMRAAVREAVRRFGSIHGAFHCAGTLSDGLIQLKERPELRRVLDPKVLGAPALAEALGGQPLDFLVLFSSVSAVLGLQGQVDYAAANAFLEAFAHQHTKRSGVRTIAIDWGAWREAGLAARAAEVRRRGHRTDEPSHPWLGQVSLEASGSRTFSVTLNRREYWLLSEHKLKNGPAILPGTGYLELLRVALEETAGASAIELSNVLFEAPFLLHGEEERTLTISLDAAGNLAIQSEKGRVTHVSAHAQRLAETAPPAVDLRELHQRCNVLEETVEGFLSQDFMDFGPRWANVRSIRYGANEALVLLALPAQFAADAEHFALHPALLDMATGGAQRLIPAFNSAADFYVPFSYGRFRMYRPLPHVLLSHVRLRPGSGAAFDISLLAEDGSVVATIDEFVMRQIDPQSLAVRAQASASAEPGPGASAAQQATEIVREGMRPAEGIEALHRILHAPVGPQIMCVPIDLHQWMQQLERPPSGTRARRRAAAEPEPLEKRIARVWEQVLGVECVGLQDDFFALGGHSLLLVRMATRLEKEFGMPIPLSFLFQSATVARIAEYVKQRLGEAPSGTASSGAAKSLQFFVPFNDKGQGPAFYCVHSMGGDATYRALAKLLDPEQNFYGIQIPPELRNAEFTSSVEQMAHRYVDELLAFQPEGPYLLGGRSGGAPVALEMAQELRARGKEVALLVSIDGIPFNTGTATSRYSPVYWWKVVRNLPHWIAEDLLPDFSWQGFARRVANKLRGKLTASKHGHTQQQVRKFLYGAEFSDQAIVVMESFYASVLRYIPKPYSGRVLLFQATAEPMFALEEVDLAWKKLAADLEIVRIRGTHQTVVDASRIGPLAAALNLRLRALREKALERTPHRDLAA
jgi:acyl transferase domain-containing protein/thioesterase domain-containing protein/acyl carrier protein